MSNDIALKIGSQVGRKIKTLMERNKITSAQLAKDIDRSLPTVSRLISGTSTFNWEILHSVARALGTSISVLTNTDDPVSLTGIKAIDEATLLINSLLHDGIEGYYKCAHLFAPEYKLVYAYRGWNAPDRVFQGTAKDEFCFNKKNTPEILRTIKSARIVGETLQNHLLTISPLDHDLTNETGLRNDFKTVSTEVIDTWTFTKTIKQISAGSKVQIRRRYLNVLRVSQGD